MKNYLRRKHGLPDTELGSRQDLAKFLRRYRRTLGLARAPSPLGDKETHAFTASGAYFRTKRHRHTRSMWYGITPF